MVIKMKLAEALQERADLNRRIEQLNARLYRNSKVQPGRVSETVRAHLSDKMRRDLQKELERTGISLEQVLARYHLERIEQMKPEHYRDAMSGLKKSNPVAAA